MNGGDRLIAELHVWGINYLLKITSTLTSCQVDLKCQ